MSLIRVVHLTFAYEGAYQNIFEDISFDIDSDWKLGLTGRNGRGKTTLLRLLNGELEYQGRIETTVGCDYFPFQLPDPERETISLLSSLVPEAAQWQLERELQLLHIEESAFTRPFRSLSAGEQTKSLLAVMFLRQNRFLLLDEPTNHLDLPARRLVGEYLRGKRGFLLVSHDRDFLDSCVDHIMNLHKTKIDIQRGNFSTWWENVQRRETAERTADERLRREIKHLTEEARRTAAWADKVEKSKFGNRDGSGVKPDKGYIGAKSAKMMKRSLNAQARRERAVAEKQELLQDVERADALFLRPLKHHASLLVEARNLAIHYSDQRALGPFDFSLQQGQRLALLGANGSGKSSLLKLVLGQQIPYSGQLRLAGGLIISYLPQRSDFLRGSLREYVRDQGLDERLCLTLLRKLDFSREHFQADMAELSAGQQKKLLLAASLMKPAHLYLWDEPLNYIDVLSRMQIEEVIIKYAPTLLIVEHDAAFIRRVATDCLYL